MGLFRLHRICMEGRGRHGTESHLFVPVRTSTRRDLRPAQEPANPEGGTGDGSAHPGLLAALPDDRRAARLDDPGVDAQALRAELGGAHRYALGIHPEVRGEHMAMRGPTPCARLRRSPSRRAQAVRLTSEVDTGTPAKYSSSPLARLQLIWAAAVPIMPLHPGETECPASSPFVVTGTPAAAAFRALGVVALTPERPNVVRKVLRTSALWAADAQGWVVPADRPRGN